MNEIASTIIEQLGGPRALSLMLGLKHILTSDKGVDIRFACKNERRINHVRVMLTPRDTYDMTFYRIAKGGLVCDEVSANEDVCADSLIEVFERTTGLGLRLPGGRR